MHSQEILNHIAQTIIDKKGFNVLALDVQDISTITDYFIIAEGNVDRHVRAIAGEVVSSLKEKGVPTIFQEGMTEGDWVVLDYLDVIVHIFVPEMRQKYRLEELWKAGKVVDLNIRVSEVQ